MIVDLRNATSMATILSLDEGSVQMVHADPPWKYDGGQGKRGHAQGHYSGMDMAAIATDLDAAFDAVASPAYMALWCTLPLLGQWFAHGTVDIRWRHVSGAAWGKTNGTGMGHHFRGDTEVVLLYRKANPKPKCGALSNLWLAPRIGHSRKPGNALRHMAQMGCRPGETLLDLYAGDAATMALECRRLGIGYIGAEADQDRWTRAQGVLSQGELFGGAAA